jgi:hypothetical protein
MEQRSVQLFFMGPDFSSLRSKTAESQLTRGEIWAEFCTAQVSTTLL